MSSPAKDTSGNDDVLASIRRLVAEESARGAPRGKAEPAPEPEVAQNAPAPSSGRVLQRRRPTEGSSSVDRQSIARAARAKLLLTDDFRIEDDDFEADEVPALPAETEAELQLPPEPEEEEVAVAAPRRTPTGRTAFNDDHQAEIEADIDSFLNADAAPEPLAEPERAPEPAFDAEAPQEIAFEDIPDAVLAEANPIEDRAAKRREAAARAAEEANRASAALRAAPEPQPEPEPEPEIVEDVAPAAQHAAAPASAPVAASSTEIAASTAAQIEAAVQASLRAFAEETDLVQASPAEPAPVQIDEDLLREMVSDIVRRELQGSLGERITRNVRKLVRREIYRALEARDLG